MIIRNRSLHLFTCRFRVFLFALCLSLLHAQASSPVESVRNSVKEWALAEQTRSREAADWQVEKQLMIDLKRVLEQEIKGLKDTIATSEASLNEADETRNQLLKKRAENINQRQILESFVGASESRVFALQAYLPTPLSERLAPVFKRIPQNTSETSLSLAERMQTVITVLDALRSFDQKITLHKEIRPSSSDNPAQQVSTLYVGLAQAYYLGSEDAGIGYPSAKGWHWESLPSIRKELEAAFAIASDRDMNSRFIDLPLHLNPQLEP